LNTPRFEDFRSNALVPANHFCISCD